MPHVLIAGLYIAWRLLKYIWGFLGTSISIAGLGSKHDEPIISSADMLGSKGLQSMAVGTVEGFGYNLLTNGSGKVMMFISLKHNTYLHFIAIGGKSQLASNISFSIRRKWLEPVHLEGNFSDDFKMYCSRNRQMEIRQVFAPDTMSHFQDFCRAYNFELFHDTVYISQAQGADDENDTTAMTTDIMHFVKENKRLLERI